MKKHNGFAVTYLMTAILLLLSALVFFTYLSQRKNLRDESNIANKNTLTTALLPNGDIVISDFLSNIKVTVSAIYNLTGEAGNFTVSFHGIDSGKNPGPRDFSQLQFRYDSLNGNLYEKVKEEYRSSNKNNDSSIDYNDIKKIKLGNIDGFYYSCPFLVTQECIYLPLANNSQKYLFILKSFSDENNRGYEKELDQILNSVTAIKYEGL